MGREGGGMGGGGAGKKCEEANGQLVLPLVSFIHFHPKFQFHLLELLLRERPRCGGASRCGI